MRVQRGFTLLEALVAAGVIAVAAGACLAALAAFARYGAHQAGADRTAATAAAEQTLRIAADAWKYGAPGSAPAGSWQTVAPIAIPGATPTTIPLNVTAVETSRSDGADLSVTVSYPPDPGHDDPGTLTIRGQAWVEAPVPGSQVAPGGLVPLPSGAP